jgi:F-type H+-transporting ATPase subunit b
VELSWTTFLLEAINFLVLLWLLKRLLYAPVKRVIAERRAAVEKTLQEAVASRREAQDLQSRYEGRLREWEMEKERQKEEFRKEISDERTRQLKLTENLVAQEREKAEAQVEKKAAERRMNEEREAMQQALKFTSCLLKDLACPQLEGKIVELVTKQLSSAEPEGFPPTAAPSWDHGAAVQVRSAYSLTERQRDTLTSVLKSKLGTEGTIEFAVDRNLLAGLEIALGSFVLRANLRDELEYFSAMRNHE